MNTQTISSAARRRATAKKPTARKPVAKKAPAKKAPAKKVAAKKPAPKPKPKPKPKPAPKPAPKPVPKPVPVDKTPAPPVQAPPVGNVGGNSSGTIQLQTNADIEREVLEAEQYRQQMYSQAASAEQQGLADYGLLKEQVRQFANTARGSNNVAEAYRGLHGTSAVRRSAEAETEISNSANQVETALQRAKESASGMKLQGDQKLDTTKSWANAARLEYTNERSRENPTYGSTPVNSGVVAPKPIAEGTKKVPAPPKLGVPKPAPKKPAAKKPVAKKPVAKKPVAKKTTVRR